MEPMFHQIIQQPLVFVVGLIVTVGLGVIVDMRLNGVTSAFRRETQAGFTAEQWAKLLEWPDAYGGFVHWLGLFERIFFYTIFRIFMWQLVAVWLLFKLGCYWGIWHSIIRVDGQRFDDNATEFIVAQSQRGNALAAMCLFGTLGNLLAALVGAFCAVLGIWMFELG